MAFDRDEWGDLANQPRFRPDPEGDGEEQARLYLEQTGRFPPSIQIMLSVVDQIGRFVRWS